MQEEEKQQEEERLKRIKEKKLMLDKQKKYSQLLKELSSPIASKNDHPKEKTLKSNKKRSKASSNNENSCTSKV